MWVVLYFFALLPFYLLGTFPTGMLIARRAQRALTSAGSGNVGAANVARVLGLRAGLLTLLGDAAKGFIAVALAALVSDNSAYVACVGLAAVCGHCFSIPGVWHGGKGVATSLGVLAWISPPLAIYACVAWIGVFLLFRIASLSSLSAAITTPIAGLFSPLSTIQLIVVVSMAGLITWRHRSNIRRLIEGRERKLTLGGVPIQGR